MKTVATAIWLAALLAANAAHAQNFPNRPVRVLVPLTPGGGADIIARVVSQKLTESLGQQFVVDNRPGAGGSVAYELAAKAAADGHTLAFATGSMITAQLSAKMPYDAVRDFAGVSTLSTQPYIFTVSSGLPVRNVQEFIALARAQSAKGRSFNYASSGIGGLIHLTGELFKTGAGIEMTHVPYKGMATAYPDVIAGLVQLAIGAQLSSVPHVKSGKLRVIGVTSAKRMPSLPEAPTVAESGIAGFEVVQWYGIATHKQTPAATVQTLNREIVKALQLPDVKTRLEADGSLPAGSTPQALDAFMRSELVKWDKVIKTAGLKRE